MNQFKKETKTQQTIIKGILNNERCNVCGKRVEQKCLTCLLDNKVAGYCPHHHTPFPFHKSNWIDVNS